MHSSRTIYDAQPSASSSKHYNGVFMRDPSPIDSSGQQQHHHENGQSSYTEEHTIHQHYVQQSFTESDSDSAEQPAAFPEGNWGKKSMKGAQFVRKGKMAAWGPTRGEWEVEERARKRLRHLLPSSRSPSPPTLSHLREDSPPTQSPYLPPSDEHTSCSTFVLDPAMAHSFRTHLLNDLQQTTDNLIEGETTLKRALGRLWVVLGEDHDDAGDLAKREETDDDDAMLERDRGLASRLSSDFSPSLQNLFLTQYMNGNTAIFEPSQFGSPQMQLENLEKSLSALRELADDSREYSERLVEIREDLGDVRRQRDLVWKKVRENALEELKTMKEPEVMVNPE
ncbi:hypothetical protein SCHPADRAFT_897793 [Schizopora paradoxa]|uniref:Transcriptional regulatory protein RXT2 N-terminal domain-containing protein n=1 Tax=Schizopora paradoxa TaxID=27342 RepID=A0A0H2S9J3_9AGAM|nr:hypothetical protein SCHPADRAFT_897793 [Schizopora paradoxa]